MVKQKHCGVFPFYSRLIPILFSGRLGRDQSVSTSDNPCLFCNMYDLVLKTHCIDLESTVGVNVVVGVVVDRHIYSSRLGTFLAAPPDLNHFRCAW
jgi:hypothetical protein